MCVKCKKCQGENIRSYDNGTLCHPTPKDIESGVMRYDNEIEIYFECLDCKTQWSRIFDVTPQILSEEPRPLPKCVKINGKVFLYGSERYEVVINDNDLNMIELFDMTTEMETGDSYSIFVSDISFFEVASDEERQAVDAFFIKSQLELFPN